MFSNPAKEGLFTTSASWEGSLTQWGRQKSQRRCGHTLQYVWGKDQWNSCANQWQIMSIPTLVANLRKTLRFPCCFKLFHQAGVVFQKDRSTMSDCVIRCFAQLTHAWLLLTIPRSTISYDIHRSLVTNFRCALVRCVIELYEGAWS